MRKEVYLFRHGETDYNVQGRWQGAGIDAPLNANGVNQAEALAQRLADINIQAVYSSPLQRALKTAEKVAETKGLEVRVLQELTEACVGVCEGMKRDDVKQVYPDIWELWYNDELFWDTRWPEGESKREICNRMNKAFAEIAAAPEDVIAVASHGGAIRYFLIPLGYGPHKIGNTAVFHLEYDGEIWKLLSPQPERS